jgi:hypothetical protein
MLTLRRRKNFKKVRKLVDRARRPPLYTPHNEGGAPLAAEFFSPLPAPFFSRAPH